MSPSTCKVEDSNTMVRLTVQEAAVLFAGKLPREIYEIAWDRVAKARDARLADLDDTVAWLVERGYLSEADLEVIEGEPEGERNRHP